MASGWLTLVPLPTARLPRLKRSERALPALCRAGELVGTGVGVAGAVILATAAARADRQATVAGDMAALLGSFAFVGYLLIGQSLRK